MVKKKVNKNSERLSNINIGNKNQINGNISGGDMIIINNSSIQIDQFIELLEHRAERIKNELKVKYESIDVENYLKSFEELHERHIKALKSGNIILAHDILIEIHKLSYRLECEKFSANMDPNKDYAMATGFGEKGPLECLYIVGDFHKNSSLYRTCIKHVNWRAKSEEEIINGYLSVFKIN